MAEGARVGGQAIDRNRVYRVEALVLKRLSVGETDRVLTLFTRERGKLSAIAKGARGPKSRLAGATEPFTYFQGLMAQGQNLDVLTQAEVQDAFPGIRKDLTRIAYASYFVELVDSAVTERQAQPALWDLLVGALATLAVLDEADVLSRCFEIQAMAQLGYEARLDACVLDDRSVDEPEAAFHPLRGGMLCAACARSVRGGIPILPETLAALRQLRQGPLLRVAHRELPQPVRREMARCLIPFIRHHLESPLRSLQFLDDVLH